MKKLLRFIGIITILLICTTSCKEEMVPVDEFTPYIAAFTSGEISSNENIIIEFTDYVGEVNTKVNPNSLISFKPKIKGKAELQANVYGEGQRLVFYPNENQLKAGQEYTCKVKLGKIIETDKRHQIFKYKFSVSPDGNTSLTSSIISPADYKSNSEKFAVSYIDFDHANRSKLSIVFTNDVSTTQNLDGLIRIKGVSSFTTSQQDNQIDVFFDEIKTNTKSITITVNKNIKNYSDLILEEDYTQTIQIEAIKPNFQLLRSGNILPDANNLILPFKAVNLKALDVEVIQIYSSNILSFLQENEIDESSSLRRYGRLVHKKTIKIVQDTAKYADWQNFSVDLSNIIKKDNNAIYRLKFSFKKEYSTYPCEDENNSTPSNINIYSTEEITENDKSYWDEPYSYYYDYDYYDYDWNWSERDNPCHPMYYRDVSQYVNVMASNIGIIAKTNNQNTIWIATSNILTAEPMANVDIVLYNYQLQVVGKTRTDGNGFATVECTGKALYLIAQKNNDKNYLRILDGNENSTSRFDVSGELFSNGIQGYIYGERGVWRPGDSVFLTFVLHDPDKKIPANHPVVFEVKNSLGQFHFSEVKKSGLNGVYTCSFATHQEDPTGIWSVTATLGSSVFYKSIRIETIKPNRLKINFSIENVTILEAKNKTAKAKLNVAWLTGAKAGDLKTRVNMSLSNMKTSFKGYEKYDFESKLVYSYYDSDANIYEGKLDADGNTTLNIDLSKDTKDAAGLLKATFTTTVAEKGGDESFNVQSYIYSPYDAYIGINPNIPENSYYLPVKKTHNFSVVALTAEGKLMSRDLNYKVYKLGWNWWWSNDGNRNFNYVNSSNYQPVAQGNVATKNGVAQIPFTADVWGRYLIVVKDVNGKHSTGSIVYFDDPYYGSQSRIDDPEAEKMLTFAMDKKEYSAGEVANVTIPATQGGKALISLENGRNVLKQEWIDIANGSPTKYSFTVTKEMCPNIYIHISLLQQYSQHNSDLPLRLYGVMPVMVNAQETKLEPVITMPSVIRPEQAFTLNVKEKSGKAMTYTVAIVDEGLLDITNFKTPNPWGRFYSREGLGIHTFDVYDRVMNAFAGKISAMYSIGGDEDASGAIGKSKATRFRPVVKFLGPFTLASGKTATHNITLPEYVGSVRTMVVASQDAAYGSAQATTPVRSPLMTLSTLPRVMSVNEEILLPVNVFAMENDVKSVKLQVQTTSGLVKLEETSKTVSFKEVGDATVYFKVKTSNKTGVEKFVITAQSGSHSSKETIEIDVRNPNPAIVLYETKTLEKNSNVEFNYVPGTEASDWAKLEILRIPSIDISRKFDFLYNYSHFCTEQLTSRALPLLYIGLFKDCSTTETHNIIENVKQAIYNLYARQTSDGGFKYWAGDKNSNPWISSYAGLFLLKAKESGYDVNISVLKAWIKYQKNQVNQWKYNQSYSTDFDQAYRLYTLALAGETNLGGMNRLKEEKDLNVRSRWLLSAAYAIDGKKKIAEDLILNLKTTELPAYSNSWAYYGSSIRDEAMILETMLYLGKLEAAMKQAQHIAAEMNRESYFCTQSSAYGLMAMASLANKTAGEIKCKWSVNGSAQSDINSKKAVVEKELSKTAKNGKVVVNNLSTNVLFVNLTNKTTPLIDNLPAISNVLKLNIEYKDYNGKVISVENLKQGIEFDAFITVSNTSAINDYRNVALTYILPSGWEVFNEGFFGDASTTRNYDYQDIRDDRVLTYFYLGRNKSQTFRIRLHANYCGNFTLPAVRVEAMYEPEIQARSTATTCKVVSE